MATLNRCTGETVKKATLDRPTPDSAPPKTMKAVVQSEYGSAEVLKLRVIDRPEIGEHDVLVRVGAASVNPGDWAIMNGLPYIARPAPLYGLRKPRHGVRGTDVAGVVDAVGTSVTRFRPGDEVFGWCRGSFAEYAAASEGRLALKPANLSFKQAAAVPMAGTVALQALRDHGKVHAGQSVLVNGASGGIGTFAVQIAKSLGAEVTGVCSSASLELVSSIGADHVIDYTKEDFTRNGERYDFILDNAAKLPLSSLRRALTPQGMLVPNGGGFDHRWVASGGRLIGAMVSFRFVSQSLGRFLVAQKHEDLTTLAEMIEAGEIRPVIDRTYSLGDTPQAVEHVERGHPRGKVVIAVDQIAAGGETGTTHD
jgi:NADPH:quinone reductase-like Zn-dependent oxidoreductase